MNPTSANNRRILTDYVRALADRADTREMVPHVVAELRLMVRAGLRRSGRLALSPKCLGCEGQTWSQVFAENTMPDIVVDYCIHLFGGSRLTYLINLVNGGGVVEPLCGGRLVNQFLYDRHSHADECGYAVYQNTLVSVRNLVDAQTLHPEEVPVTGDTAVRFTGSTADPATPVQVETVVRRERETWEPILPVLSTISQNAQCQLAERLGGLEQHNITALTTSATAAGLAPPVRDHSPQLGELPIGNFADEDGNDPLAHLLAVEPDASPNELREHLIERLEQLRAAIPNYQGSTSPTRNGMRRLVAELIRITDAGEEVIQAEIAQRFGVPTSTLNGHWQHLMCLARQLWPDE